MSEIRKAEQGDANAVQYLLKQLGYDRTVEDLAKSLSFQPNDTEVFVASEKGEIIGFISLIYFYYFPLQSRVCRITAIVVDESRRGNGIGNKLIEFSTIRATDNSCTQLEVTTSLLREKTQRYYEFLGFNKSSYRYYLEIGNEQTPYVARKLARTNFRG